MISNRHDCHLIVRQISPAQEATQKRDSKIAPGNGSQRWKETQTHVLT